MIEERQVKEFFAWLDEYVVLDAFWYMKRLGADETSAMGTQQVGPRMHRDFLFAAYPKLDWRGVKDPEVSFDLYVDSHDQRQVARAFWYNDKLGGDTNKQAKLTVLGAQTSPLFDPDNTGALVVFSFVSRPSHEEREAHVWVCRNEAEEVLVEEWFGPIEPGQRLVHVGKNSMGTACELVTGWTIFPA